jgi:hypothetical protein
MDRETLTAYAREVALCRVCQGLNWKEPCSFCEGTGVDDTVNLDALARIIEAEVAKALGEPRWARCVFEEQGVSHMYIVADETIGVVIEEGSRFTAAILSAPDDEYPSKSVEDARAWVESMVGGGEG